MFWFPVFLLQFIQTPIAANFMGSFGSRVKRWQNEGIESIGFDDVSTCLGTHR